jgi:hypothetical protein
LTLDTNVAIIATQLGRERMKAAILFELLQIVGAVFLIFFSGRKLTRLIRRWRSGSHARVGGQRTPLDPCTPLDP